jgi:uncharacterized Fe-S cluster-containing radical SAM superfamily protein
MTPVPAVSPLDGAKFTDPDRTLDGSVRAQVALDRLATLWVNTGTLCNLTCANCYIESSPTNDRLAYFLRADLRGYLDEIEARALGTREIGFTGGEPFMNPDIIGMLEDVLGRGLDALVLTNAMKPMTHHRAALKRLLGEHGERLSIRVSLDHFDPSRHDEERGSGTFKVSLEGLKWLAAEGFRPRVAGRTRWGESEDAMRRGFAALMAAEGIALDCADWEALVLFPEMDANADVPEITEACWGIVGVNPADIMCASSRMVVRRKGADAPAVLACTLIADDPRFELGPCLSDAAGAIPLAHPHCARFCVLGGGACSR